MKQISKWKISLYLVALFLIGFVTGGIVTFTAARHLMFAALRQEAMAAHWRGDLQRKLNLTPQQADRITPVINDALTGFRSAFADQVLTTLSNANVRIAAELTPEQKPKFSEIETQQQEFIRKQFGGEAGNPQKSP